MRLYTLDPLTDERWIAFSEGHARSSIFHQRGWLAALKRTYDYDPVVLTSAAPGAPLTTGLVFCRVSSWITGRRLVSLPFADHCDPLLDTRDELLEFSQWLQAECDRERRTYIEIRPSMALPALDGWHATSSFCFHSLDLQASLEQIFRNFHKNSIQRRILKAEREELSYETGSSERQVNNFYQLLIKTRQRHQLVPQPRSWFANLVAGLGNRLKLQVALKNQVPVAALLTLRHNSTVVYKYGCSDERYHYLGAMPFLFWKLIEESKKGGASEIDFGRSDWDQSGLILFKDRFGTTRKPLQYFRYSNTPEEKSKSLNLKSFSRVFALLPGRLSPLAGRLLYRHIG